MVKSENASLFQNAMSLVLDDHTYLYSQFLNAAYFSWRWFGLRITNIHSDDDVFLKIIIISDCRRVLLEKPSKNSSSFKVEEGLLYEIDDSLIFKHNIYYSLMKKSLRKNMATSWSTCLNLMYSEVYPPLSFLVFLAALPSPQY